MWTHTSLSIKLNSRFLHCSKDNSMLMCPLHSMDNREAGRKHSLVFDQSVRYPIRSDTGRGAACLEKERVLFFFSHSFTQLKMNGAGWCWGHGHGPNMKWSRWYNTQKKLGVWIHSQELYLFLFLFRDEWRRAMGWQGSFYFLWVKVGSTIQE